MPDAATRRPAEQEMVFDGMAEPRSASCSADGEMRLPERQAEPDRGGTVSAATGVVDFDLGSPMPDLVDVPALGARCLVRVQGRPIGVVDLDGSQSGVCANELAGAIQGWLGDAVGRRMAQFGTSHQRVQAAGLALPPAAPADLDPVAVTVVVATRDRADTLERCLDSLLATTPPPESVVVVDSSPSDDQARLLLERRWPNDPGITYVRESRPGLGRAHNAGLSFVSTPYVAFTDDDVVVDRRWVGALADGFYAADDVACVTGLIMPGELCTREQWWVEQGAGFGKGFDRRVRSLADSREETALFPFDAGTFGSGANMAFTIRFLRELGGFDPALGAGTRALGGDDLAALHQVVARHHTLVYEPDAVVFHRHHDNLGALRRQAFGYGAGLSAYLTHAVVNKPVVAAQIARRAASGAARLMLKSSPMNARRPADYPRHLVWWERAGMVAGPLRYLWQRRTDRRVERSNKVPS